MATRYGTRYFALALNDRTVEDPYSVFREVRKKDHYSCDLWDRENRKWKDMTGPLCGYVLWGEPGAEEIKKGQADRIIKRWQQ